MLYDIGIFLEVIASLEGKFSLMHSLIQKRFFGLSAEVGGRGVWSVGGPRAQPVIRLLKSKPLRALKHEKKAQV